MSPRPLYVGFLRREVESIEKRGGEPRVLFKDRESYGRRKNLEVYLQTTVDEDWGKLTEDTIHT